MPVKLNSSGGGSVTLDVPSTASDFTATIPANTGTVVTTGSTAAVTQGMLAAGVAGNGPAFSAYLSTDSSFSANVTTKVPFNVEEFDTASCFDTSTARFTPNVAGYYHVTGYSIMSAGAAPAYFASIFRNGSEWKRGVQINPTTGTTVAIFGSVASALIYMNGTTDYVELYGFSSGSGPEFLGGQALNYFSGFLARAA
jgi:hypothetical protein